MRGDWFYTHSGIKFYMLDPRVEDIDIHDIAHSLSHICRYGGHCPSFYSVARHSYYVALALKEYGKELALYGLLHDAAEAYIGDMIRPLKYSPGLEAYREAEDKVMAVICEKFGLPKEQPSEVKLMDDRIMMAEKRDLIRHPKWDGYDHIVPHPMKVEYSSSPIRDNMSFMRTFHELSR